MRVITKEEFMLKMSDFFAEIFKGAVFIYPTDTIYGLGCNAKNSKAVQKVRDMKDRPEAPFSVIAPSKDWIRDSCIVDEKAEEWLGKLPGPYTLVLKLKDKACVAKEVNPGADSLGVRIPQHWFSRIAAELGVPLVTTSVNKSGMKYMTSADDIDEEISVKTSFMIDEGEKKGKPSNVIFLNEAVVTMRDRQADMPYTERKKI